MNKIFSCAGNRTFLACLAALAILASVSVASTQQSFNSPDDAAQALVNAARDNWPKGVISVLGSDADEIVSSGDKTADEAMRQKFLAAYEARHEMKMEGDDKAMMIIGNQDFPFPIPLLRKGAAWKFDTAAGRLEILYRRIGRNEINAIKACLAYVDAQNEYAESDRTGAGSAAYAQRIVSRPGKKDGLYWPTAPGEEESPLGELVAQASKEGYDVGGERAPYHGYYYKILTRPRPDGRGRGGGLHRARQDDRRICAGGVSCRVRQFRRDDFPRQLRWDGFPERPR
jgi:hypothetical protein